MVARWYQQPRRPIFEEIRACLHMETDEDNTERLFNLLVGFHKEHRENEDLLWRLLCYSTGTSNVPGERIRVEIGRGNTLLMHETCFSSIHLPLTEDTREVEEAFLLQLLHGLSASRRKWPFNSG